MCNCLCISNIDSLHFIIIFKYTMLFRLVMTPLSTSLPPSSDSHLCHVIKKDRVFLKKSSTMAHFVQRFTNRFLFIFIIINRFPFFLFLLFVYFFLTKKMQNVQFTHVIGIGELYLIFSF